MLDVIRIVEGRRRALERRLVESPLRRGEPPDEPVEVAPVTLIARLAAFGGEVILVPPRELRLWRQRLLVGRLAADKIAAHRHERLQRSGQSAATMSAVRAPQSNPATIARSIRSASSSASASIASAACWPLRAVSSERKRVVP